MGIEELERIAAAHWQAPDTEPLGQWLLRAAGGFTGRANSALPVGDPGLPLPGAVAAVTAWYAGRGLPPMVAVAVPLHAAAPPGLDAFLAERAWSIRPGPAFIMTAAAAAVPAPDPGDDLSLTAEPDQAWLARYRYRGADLPPMARTLLLSAPWQGFGSIRRDGATVAVGRVSVAGGWAAISAVEVDPAWRRRGLGRAVTAGLTAAAARRGARHVLLQVETANDAARALYERCGFGYSHRYHYRVAP